MQPPNDAVRGSGLKCTWLARTFSDLPKGDDEGTVEIYAKAYLLYLIGAVLFADKTRSQVHILYLTLLDTPWEPIAGYSWGFGALAYLYTMRCLKEECEGDLGAIDYPGNSKFKFLFLYMFKLIAFTDLCKHSIALGV